MTTSTIPRPIKPDPAPLDIFLLVPTWRAVGPPTFLTSCLLKFFYLLRHYFSHSMVWYR